MILHLLIQALNMNLDFTTLNINLDFKIIVTKKFHRKQTDVKTPSTQPSPSSPPCDLSYSSMTCTMWAVSTSSSMYWLLRLLRGRLLAVVPSVQRLGRAIVTATKQWNMSTSMIHWGSSPSAKPLLSKPETGVHCKNFYATHMYRKKKDG